MGADAEPTDERPGFKVTRTTTITTTIYVEHADDQHAAEHMATNYLDGQSWDESLTEYGTRVSHDFHIQETGHLPLGHTLLDADGVPVFTAVREGRRHG